MRVLAGTNAVLALISELALLAAGIAIGLTLPAPLPVRVVVAVVLPVAVLAVWAFGVGPRAPRRLPARQRLLVETALFAVGVLGLAAVGLTVWALVLALLVAVRFVLGAQLGRV